MPVELTGSSAPVVLGTGYTIRAPGLRGRADMALPAAPGLRGAGLPTDPADAALAAQSVRIARTIELQITDRAAESTTLRSAARRAGGGAGDPRLRRRHAQVILAADESGVMRWHLPTPVGDDAGACARRPAGGGCATASTPRRRAARPRSRGRAR
jgi:hypothetical protein